VGGEFTDPIAGVGLPEPSPIRPDSRTKEQLIAENTDLTIQVHTLVERIRKQEVELDSEQKTIITLTAALHAVTGR
jgi:hypothetical protein